MIAGFRAIRRSGFGTAWLAALFLPIGAHAAPADGDIRYQLANALALAQQALNADDCPGALKPVEPIIASPDFGTLPDKARLPFLSIAAFCEAQTDRQDAALAHALAASELPGATNFMWRLRFGLEMGKSDTAAAVTTLEKMQDLSPASWSEIKDEWVFALFRSLARDKYSPAHLRLLALVSRADFQPAQTELGYDWPRLTYAQYLARNGDKEGAKALLNQLRASRPLRDASVDSGLRGMMPADFDLRAARERELELLEVLQKGQPSILAFPISIAASQRALGEPVKALQTLESARPYGILAKMFTDRDDKINWWWDELARTYQQLGRYDDAQAAYRQAIAEGEHGGQGRNISQVINLAYLQHRFGHNKDALETLASVKGSTDGLASPYGMMEFHLAQGCAAWDDGQKDLAEKDLAYAREHEKDHPEALGDLYMCMGDLDAAAASLIARLDDPDRRTDALVQISEYDEAPANVPPDPFKAPIARLRERADVQAAIKRAGGIRRFHVLAETL